MPIIDKQFEVEGKKYNIVVDYDQFMDDPRGWADSEMCVRDHRRYSFPNEMNFDFGAIGNTEPYEEDDDGNVIETLEDHEMKRLEDFHVFWLDMYEHSGIAFSFAGEGMQCQFDTAKMVGFLAYDKATYPTRLEALEVAKRELKLYNHYANGEGYIGTISEIIPLYDKDGNLSDKYDLEQLDDVDCISVYEIEDIVDYVPEKFKEAVSDAIASY